MNVRNHIHLTGNLGTNPDTGKLVNGRAVTSFRLATNKYYRNAEGERRTSTEWHTVKAFGKLAELFDEHLSKGSAISIVGSMHYRSWTDKYDQPRRTAEVIAEEFTFLGRKADAVPYETPEEHLSLAAEPLPTEATITKPQKQRTKRGSGRSRRSTNMGEVIESVEALEA